MAAIDHHSRVDALQGEGEAYLAAAELRARVEEEIHRAQRHGTPLSCLLLAIDNLREIAREHDSELLEQTLAYVGDALARELRDFDRIGRPSAAELLIVLPGADGPHGEIVARRLLGRLATIKVEAQGQRQPLRVSLGLASWQTGYSDEDLLARARAAARVRNGDELPGHEAQTGPFAQWHSRRAQFGAEDPQRR
jgi:two-component system, cell cycle response regulator